MLTRIEALRFRTLRCAMLRVDRFQPLLGRVGTGKGALLDVPAFIRDVLRVGPECAVLGDADRGVARRAQAPRDLVFGSGDSFELAVEVEIPIDLRKLLDGDYTAARYEVEVAAPGDGTDVGLGGETLWLIPASNGLRDDAPHQGLLFDMHEAPSTLMRAKGPTPRGWRRVLNRTAEVPKAWLGSETSTWAASYSFAQDRAVLAQLQDDAERFPVATHVRRLLVERTLRLRNPFATERSRTQSTGFITRALASDPAQVASWIEHVRRALPWLEGVSPVERESEHQRFLVSKTRDGTARPLHLESESVLSLLASTAAGFLSPADSIVLVENPDVGLDDDALGVVVSALWREAAPQVIFTSASPRLADLVRAGKPIGFERDSTGACIVSRALA